MSGLTVHFSHGDEQISGTLTSAVLRCRFVTGYDEEWDGPLYCNATTDPLAAEPLPCGHTGSVERVLIGTGERGNHIEVTFSGYDPTDQWSVLVASLPR